MGLPAAPRRPARPWPAPGPLGGIRAPVVFLAGPAGASCDGGGGGPAGGQRPVQQDGRNGRDQGGAERDQGDLPARHAADGDDRDGSRQGRRGRGEPAWAARLRDPVGEGGRDDGS